MAAAHLGIAVASATELAKGSADVSLASADLGKILHLLKVAKLTNSLVRGNLVWAFVYNLAALPAAAMGFLSPELAALAMIASSLTVTLNSLRKPTV